MKFNSAEISTLVLSLALRGIHARERGHCIGLLRSEHVFAEHGLVFRSVQTGWFHTVRNQRSARAHQRTGHDGSCLTLGVPSQTWKSLCNSWGEPGLTELISDAVSATVNYFAASSVLARPKAEPSLQEKPAQKYESARIYRVFTDEVTSKLTPIYIPEYRGDDTFA